MFVRCVWCVKIEEYCKLSGAEIVGCYAANERFEDKTLGSSALKLANKISEHFNNTALLLVRPHAFTLSLSLVPINVTNNLYVCRLTIQRYPIQLKLLRLRYILPFLVEQVQR